MAEDISSDGDTQPLRSAYSLRKSPDNNSSLSIYSADGGQGKYEITGHVLVAIWYEDMTLYILIKKAENLAKAKNNRLSDPYVKTYLLPDPLKLTIRRTYTHTRTVNPGFFEIIKYRLPWRDIEDTVVVISVWDRDNLGRNFFLGQRSFQLCSWDLTDSTEEWYELEERTDDVVPTYIGKMSTRIKYDEKKNSLMIRIRKCTDLPNLQFSCNNSNVFVRLLLLPDVRASSIRETKIVRNTANPVWKEEFIYNGVTCNELKYNRVLEASLWNIDNQGICIFVGCIRLGPKPDESNYIYRDWMDSSTSEWISWNSTFDNAGNWINACHILRPSIKSLFSYFEDESDSGSNVCSDVPLPGDYSISGSLLINLDYREEIMYFHILRALNLPAAKNNGLSDPFLKMYLLQGNTKVLKWTSDVKKETLNPSFNETVHYKVKPFYLPLHTLFFTAWDKHESGKNKFLGEFKVQLSNSLALNTPQWFEFVEDSDACVETDVKIGQLSLSLSFEVDHILDITYGKLIACIKNAIDLSKSEGQEGCLGIFTKLYLLPFKASESQKNLRQSKVVQSGPKCVWNEKFEYDNLILEQLSNEHVLEVTVWEETLLRESNFIGGLRIGQNSNVDITKQWMDSSDQEAEHWEEMILNPNCYIERCHTLRPSMHYKRSSTFTPAESTQIINLENPLSSSQLRTGVAIAAKPKDEITLIGQLIVSVMFKFTSKKHKPIGNLYVKIKKPELLQELNNVFVVCRIVSRSCSTKLPEVIENPENPNWGQLYIFEKQLQDELSSKKGLEVSVCHKDVQVGRVCLGPVPSKETKESGMDSNEKEVQHWQAVFLNPDEWVELLHSLKP